MHLMRILKRRVSKSKSKRERASRNGSTVVLISITSFPSFNSVFIIIVTYFLLFLKHPKQFIFFNVINFILNSFTTTGGYLGCVSAAAVPKFVFKFSQFTSPQIHFKSVRFDLGESGGADECVTHCQHRGYLYALTQYSGEEGVGENIKCFCNEGTSAKHKQSGLGIESLTLHFDGQTETNPWGGIIGKKTQGTYSMPMIDDSVCSMDVGSNSKFGGLLTPAGNKNKQNAYSVYSVKDFKAEEYKVCPYLSWAGHKIGHWVAGGLKIKTSSNRQDTPRGESCLEDQSCAKIPKKGQCCLQPLIYSDINPVSLNLFPRLLTQLLLTRI